VPYVNIAAKKTDCLCDQPRASPSRHATGSTACGFPPIEKPLEGDLTLSGVEMKAGDYCRAEPGSIHTDITTRGGNVIILIASERNESLD